MSSTTYVLRPFTGVTTHFNDVAKLVHDGADMGRLELETHVRSGDYLVTLATTLDTISQLLAAANDAERVNLQRIINDLLYLDRHYQLTKKQPR